MKVKNLYLFIDSSSKLEELMGASKELGENITAFALKDDVKKAYLLGANEVYELKDGLLENSAKVLAKFLKDKEGLVLFSNTRSAKNVSSLLSAYLNVGLSTEVSRVEIQEDGLLCTRMVYGGLATSKECIKTKLALVNLTSGAYEAKTEEDGVEKEALSLENAEELAIKCINKTAKQASNIDLNRAKRIVGVGRGIAKKEDLELMQELSSLINAELGCSRPIAESEKWMEPERYIGISSVMAKPDIYLCVGISGQIQHMVGVKDSNKIIAINKDKNAPIFNYADYGIVGDLYKVVPALITALKDLK